MKKTNVILSIIVIVSFIVSISAISYSYSSINSLSNLPKEITSFKEELSSKDEQLSKLNSMLDKYTTKEYDEDRCRDSFDEETIWLTSDIQQGQKTIKSNEDFIIEAGSYKTVAFASNVTIDEKNSNYEVERHYKLIDPTQSGYLVLDGVETGLTFITLFPEEN